MKKYTTEQKAQALKLLEQDGATSHRRTHHGIHPHRQRLGESPHRHPATSSASRRCENAHSEPSRPPHSQAPAPEEPLHRETVRATQRHATDLQALRNKALQATMEGTPP
jgi:hypothetical protein